MVEKRVKLLNKPGKVTVGLLGGQTCYGPCEQKSQEGAGNERHVISRRKMVTVELKKQM